MTGFLASVADLEEARIAADLGADIVDLKDPARGALGAWKLADLRAAVQALGHRAALSATTGDLPMEPGRVAAAAAATAATGVRYVKVGFFGGGDPIAGIAALAPLARAGAGLVAVLMADRQPEFALLPRLAEAGFAGVMLDTASKAGGDLRAHQDDAALAHFVAAAQSLGLMAGLAGSLRLADIAPLAALGPDYLGFRGALCRGGRASALHPAAVTAVRDAIASSSASRSATAAAGAQVAAIAAA